MQIDVKIKIPPKEILKAYKELDNFRCLRKEVAFELQENNWTTSFTCGGYGNGYGVGFSCSEKCRLRITDLSKCKEVETEVGNYLIQN